MHSEIETKIADDKIRKENEDVVLKKKRELVQLNLTLNILGSYQRRGAQSDSSASLVAKRETLEKEIKQLES